MKTQFISSETNNDVTVNSYIERDCLKLNDCEYYRMLLSYRIAGLRKEHVGREIEGNLCKFDENDKKEEGNNYCIPRAKVIRHIPIICLD